VLGRSGAVDKVQEVVVLGVDEEQGSAGLGLASVGHGEGADLVTELGTVRLVELIWGVRLVGSKTRGMHRCIPGGYEWRPLQKPVSARLMKLSVITSLIM